ncbi:MULTISPECIES: aminotransferase class V-fold PLP-dependent enzyme [unclassified Pseudovibrio]|uniref:aminotransferase class V-fold PLP-dependent enzyme n=1 Tax=unclassified Pseudovibrio TaxID=2627060 RepID=UPI0007AE41B9|nr:MULTISPECIES: aminotransferase class V-fold PLP-dependent enzyme [unclassified Pseudovibrio]KZK98904.1 putative cysteine desulfurase [Pseudovibrio sp. W74]KZL09397.1 putative cysteine desulfurase [Pseudovibrio sp. Ad14]
MCNLIDKIRKSVIGEDAAIATVFGRKPLVYADYTASGRSLSMIEDYIRDHVLPYYANTHTETSYTGAQTTALREQARQQIRSSVNATDDHSVIFCGSGATSAIHKLIDILNLKLPADLSARYKFEQQIPEKERPVVFIGPYEHHSNELPWRESIADVVSIPLCEGGQVCLDDLEKQLIKYADRPLKIGSFSAASNVTGVKTDVDTVARLLHKHGALSFWDYAAAAPYVGIDMAGAQDEQGDSTKDAIFLSPHKFVGGPGTPGVLIVNNAILQNRVPAMPGGGTVMYVTPEDHRYVANAERREEGGTPAIIESVRAGLVFKLQQAVGTDEIERREESFVSRAVARWSKCENIEILGNTEAPRLSITSLKITHKGKDLHYSFVVALLNDLFGIQARGGCSCAGPYGHALLGMDMHYSKALEEQLVEGHMILRPGWIRLNFNYFIDEETFEYLVRAIELVAEHGWKLLPFYRFDQNGAVWRYQNHKTELAASLETLDFNALPEATVKSDRPSLAETMKAAEAELLRNHCTEERYNVIQPQKVEDLRWFVRPQDVAVA